MRCGKKWFIIGNDRILTSVGSIIEDEVCCLHKCCET